MHYNGSAMSSSAKKAFIFVLFS